MITPAFAHGTTPGRVLPATGSAPSGASKSGILPVSELTRAVMLPSPVSSCWTKTKRSTTASPFGPTTTQSVAAPHGVGPPSTVKPSRTVSTAASNRPITQPRTVRNFVHSDLTNCAKPASVTTISDRYAVAVIGGLPAQGRVADREFGCL